MVVTAARHEAACTHYANHIAKRAYGDYKGNLVRLGSYAADAGCRFDSYPSH